MEALNIKVLIILILEKKFISKYDRCIFIKDVSNLFAQTHSRSHAMLMLILNVKRINRHIAGVDVGLCVIKPPCHGV